jgi:phenylpropionate dioxygenase-like ring-hydroxylating dioxygenase large terminal subunit
VHAKLQSEVKLEGALAHEQIVEGVRSNMHLVHSHSRCSCQVYVDNYLDGGYHVSVLHKTLNAQVRRRSLDGELIVVAAPLTQVTAIIAAGRKPVLYPGARQMVPSELPRDKQPGQCRHLADE